MAQRAGQPGSSSPAAAQQAGAELLKAGEAQIEAMRAVQKELLEEYGQISHAWLERVKSETALWSELAAKISGARSVPDALSAYQECVAQRMQIAAEDGRRIFEDSQKIVNAITRAMANR